MSGGPSPFSFRKIDGVWHRRSAGSTGRWLRLTVRDLPHDPAAFADRSRSNGVGPVVPTKEWVWG